MICRSKKLWLAVTLILLSQLGACERDDRPQGKRSEAERKELSDPVAEWIRQLTWGTARAKLPRSARENASAVTAFHTAREFAPAWSDRGALEQLTSALTDLALDGLEPKHYGLEYLTRSGGEPPATKADAILQEAERDLLATHAHLLALTHLQRGKLGRNARAEGAIQTSSQADSQQETPALDLQSALDAVADEDIGRAFAEARPENPGYQELRDALEQLRVHAEEGGWPKLPAGPALRPGMSEPRIAILRQRLAAGGYLPSGDIDNPRYGDELAEAVRKFQTDQFLKVDGTVNAETHAALNTPLQARIDQMRVNLERARWQLRELGREFVLVDVAGYEVRYYQNAKPVLVSRAQVGTTETPTPMLRSEITHVTFNPMWTVRPGMLERDVLPKIEEDAGWLRRNRVKVVDYSGRELDPDEVDWDDADFMLRQEAGERGALGRAAIRFPSRHIVFLHETPYKKLFDRTRRAFSNGCIRTEQAMELAQQLLGWDDAAVERILADGKTHEIPLTEPVPMLLAYWTVNLHEDGRIAYRPDVYGLDAPTLQALNAA